MIFVNTPTGRIGRRVVDNLVLQGAEVGVLARRPETLSAAVTRAVKVTHGTLDDVPLLIEATKGATALLWVIPTNLFTPDVRAHYCRYGRVAAEVVRTNRISHVVFVSSGGYGVKNAGPIGMLHDVEDILNDVCENLCVLRCGGFMENFLPYANSLKTKGAFSTPLPGDVGIPLVCTADIGDAATARLCDRGWSGRVVQPVHGPADLTMNQAAVEIGLGVGKAVRFVEIAPDDARTHWLQAGMSRDGADQLLAMYAAMSNGAYNREPRSPDTAAPTTLKQWSETVLAPAVRG